MVRIKFYGAKVAVLFQEPASFPAEPEVIPIFEEVKGGFVYYLAVKQTIHPENIFHLFLPDSYYMLKVGNVCRVLKITDFELGWHVVRPYINRQPYLYAN